jgi:hypothetical protein
VGGGTSLLASYKVVSREGYTEGSRTATVGTDEQKLHKRLVGVGKVAHHTEAYNQRMLTSRCSSDRQKENALTWGGLGIGRIATTEKSADAIVPDSNEL